MDTTRTTTDAGAMSADGPDLAGLIAANRRGRSYQRIATDSGGSMTSNRVQQLASGVPTPVAFPSPDTIRGLARALATTESEVVAAAARSVGIAVRYGIDPRALVIGGAGDLPGDARDAIVSVAQSLLTAYDSREVGDHEQRSAPIVSAPRPPAGTGEPAPVLDPDEPDTDREPTTAPARSDGRSQLRRGLAHGSSRRSSGKQPPRHT